MKQSAEVISLAYNTVDMRAIDQLLNEMEIGLLLMNNK